MLHGELQPAAEGAVILHLVPGASSEERRSDAISVAAELSLDVNHRLAATPMHRRREGLLTAGFWLALVPAVTYPIFWSLPHDVPWELLACTLPLAATVALYRQLGRDQTAVLRAIPQFESSWIGPLIDATLWPDAAVRRTVRAKLLQLLPHLSPTDGDRLTPEQHTRFNELLLMPGDKELRTALFEGAIQLGDADTAGIVEAIASSRAITPSQRYIRGIARVCLPKLRARLRAVEESQGAGAAAQSNFVQVRAGLVSAESAYELQTEDERLMLETLNGFDQEVRGRSGGMRMGFLLAGWGIIVPFTVWKAISAAMQHGIAEPLVWTAAAAAATQLYRFSFTHVQAARARLLAEFDKVECVGPLASMLEVPVQENRQIAIEALVKLLPRLKASDASLLNDTQRKPLYRALRPSAVDEHPDLAIAILDALAQVGDDKAIEPVTRLATDIPLTGKPEKVRQAAHDCLLYLPQRARESRQSQQLLRASAADSYGAESLLRPARESDECNSTQLLRPGDLS